MYNQPILTQTTPKPKKEQILESTRLLPIKDREWVLSQLTNHVHEAKKIPSPDDLYNKCLKKYANKKQEHFIVIELDGANVPQKTRVVTIGLLHPSQIHSREVFADAIKNRAASIIIAHNHPSGLLKPSPEDLHITKKIKAAGEILGIAVLDHLIFSKGGYCSMIEEGDF